MSRVLVGPLGGLLDVGEAPAGAGGATVRPSSSVTALSGRVVSQRAPAGSRRWRLSLNWADDTVGRLIALEQGTYGPPPWWFYDPMVALFNMLPPAAGTPGLGGDLTYLAGDVAVSVPVMVDGGRHVWTVEATGLFTAPALDGSADPLPVLPGRTYTGSFYGDGTVALRWVDADGADLAGAVSATGAVRTSVTGEAPATAAGVLVDIDPSGPVAACQLNEGTLRGWMPGEGLPRVTISGLEQVYQLATQSRQARDVTVELVEVGRGGRDQAPAALSFGGFEG